MSYFQPTVIYRNPSDDRSNAILRYIGQRVLTQNKNFLCAIVGQTGMGKSWAGISMCEQYSKMYGIPFKVNIHVIHTLKQMLSLIKTKELEKNIQIGTPLLFEEPQTAANARDWQSESNKMLSALLSTFRNQRLVVFFSTPYLSMIDKQSRILFHGEFKALGFDIKTGESNLKPRFLEYNGDMDKFYHKMLIVLHKQEGKRHLIKDKAFNWIIPKASKELLDEYEAIKQKFSVNLIDKLWNQLEKSENKKEMADKPNSMVLFDQIKDLYMVYGDNYIKIRGEIGEINPSTYNKCIYLIKRSLISLPPMPLT
jgi:hypothetical protein